MLKEDALRDLGEDIRRVRKEMGMTLETLAGELGIDFRVLSRYETGHAEMGAVMYRELMRLHEQKTKGADLLQQIQKLPSTDRLAIETIVASMSAKYTRYCESNTMQQKS